MLYGGAVSCAHEAPVVGLSGEGHFLLVCIGVPARPSVAGSSGSSGSVTWISYEPGIFGLALSPRKHPWPTRSHAAISPP